MSDTLAFHAASPDGDQGFVVLLQRPGADGLLRTTEWPAGGYLAPGQHGASSADDVLARVRAWRSAGWALSEPLERIEGWLRHPPR